MATFTIERIVQGRSTKGGHAIEIDLESSDGAHYTVECPMERASMLVHAIHNAAVVAERAVRTAPGQALSTEVPYTANNVRTRTSVDGQNVLLQFQIVTGFPVMIAMPLELARRTIELLSNELDPLRRQPPLRRS
jgi:hypothetical protein